MNSKFFEYIEPTKIPYLEIGNRLGFPNNKIPDSNLEKIDELIDRLKKIWNPKAVIKTSKVKEIEKDRIITEDLILPGEKAIEVLKNSKMISFFAATLGEKAATLLKDLKENLTEYFFLDAIESEIIEQIIEELNLMINKTAMLQGYKTTRRISPGYLDIPLSFQKPLLEYLDNKKLGITINEKYIMYPEKSITAILGWIKQ